MGAVKNYVYRMDHDTGLAPNTSYKLCSLTGCKNRKSKRKNIEELAQPGSFVIGIGGKGTGQPDKIVYLMEVEENLNIVDFKRKYPKKSGYLKGHPPGERVLISKKFYYFGKNAIDIPSKIKDALMINGPGFKNKKVTVDVINELKKSLPKKYGVHGRPNNKKTDLKCGGCKCG